MSSMWLCLMGRLTSSRLCLTKVSLKMHIPQDDLHPGSTIILAEWTVIRNKYSEEGVKRGTIFVSHFDFDTAPHSGSKKSGEETRTLP